MKNGTKQRCFSVGFKVLMALAFLTYAAGLHAQTIRTLTGTVADENDEPLIGATVIIKGTSNGIATDLDGRFTLSTDREKGKLVVSYVGYESKEVDFTKSISNFNIKLTPTLSNLDDIVVIGYGTAKRSDFTGSISSVKLEDSPLSLVPNTSAMEGLKGSVSGLDVGYTNGAGGSPGLQIRGQNSLNGSNAPLIVVDGVIFMGSINDLNPADIASVDVMKDATSAAVFGSRSANGVICITTKKGKAGKPVISVSAKTGIDMWACKPRIMTAEEWLEFTMARNNYTDPSFLSAQQMYNYENNNTTDWYDLTTRTGFTQDYQAAVSGANDRVNYYLSASYTDVKGIVVGDDYSRLTVKGRLETTINDWVKLGGDASYTRADYSGNGANLWLVQVMSPYGMPYRPDGKLEKYPSGTNDAVNPLWGVNDGTADNKDIHDIYRINGFGTLTCPYIPGLSYKLNFSIVSEQSNISNFTHETYFTSIGAWDDESRYSATTQKSYLANAAGSDSRATNSSWVIDNILNYHNTFGKHNIDLTAVATRDSRHYYYSYREGRDFSANGNTSLGMNGLQFGKIQKINTDANRVRNIGYLGRASYNFNDTYFVTGTYRRDGASVFGDNSKWGNFAAVGLAWRISNESFMKNIKWIDNLKLKASWGRNGNQGIGAYTTLSRVAAGATGGIKVTFGNSGKVNYGINQYTIGNADLGWETTEAFNFGLEAALIGNRLFADIDVYLSRTYDQLFNRTIPVMGGFAGIMSSMGEVSNKGVELTLRSLNITNKDFSWQSALTFWLNRDKLNKLYGEDLNGDGIEDDDIGNNLFIGESIHSVFGYKQIGIVQEDDTDYMQKNGVQAGTPKYLDYNGNGVIDVDDRHIIGNTTPSFKLNLSNTFNYKNFELYAMITGAFGGNGYYVAENKGAYVVGGGAGSFGVISMYVPYWTPENKSDKYPSATFTGDDKFKGLQDRTYVRLSDVTLSYNFDMPWMQKAGLNKFQIYLAAKNLVTFSKWEGGDPEMASSILTGSYPIAKNISVGLNLSF